MTQKVDSHHVERHRASGSTPRGALQTPSESRGKALTNSSVPLDEPRGQLTTAAFGAPSQKLTASAAIAPIRLTRVSPKESSGIRTPRRSVMNPHGRKAPLRLVSKGCPEV